MSVIELENNIFPKEVDRTFFSVQDRAIVQSLKRQATDICRRKLSREYVMKAFNRFKYGYVYKDDEGSILGFCIWKDNKEVMKNGEFNTYTHILLICAEETDLKLGKKMLYDMEDYCFRRGIVSIQLEPANTKLESYYEHLGYKRILTKPPYTMEKEIKIEMIPHRSSTITGKTLKKKKPQDD